MVWLVERYDVDTTLTQEKQRAMISVRYNMEKSGFGMTTSYTFAEGTSCVLKRQIILLSFLIYPIYHAI